MKVNLRYWSLIVKILIVEIHLNFTRHHCFKETKNVTSKRKNMDTYNRELIRGKNINYRSYETILMYIERERERGATNLVWFPIITFWSRFRIITQPIRLQERHVIVSCLAKVNVYRFFPTPILILKIMLWLGHTWNMFRMLAILLGLIFGRC